MLAKGQEIELVRLEKKRILIQYNIVIGFFSLSQVLEINVSVICVVVYCQDGKLEIFRQKNIKDGSLNVHLPSSLKRGRILQRHMDVWTLEWNGHVKETYMS